MGQHAPVESDHERVAGAGLGREIVTQQLRFVAEVAAQEVLGVRVRAVKAGNGTGVDPGVINAVQPGGVFRPAAGAKVIDQVGVGNVALDLIDVKHHAVSREEIFMRFGNQF